MPLVCAELGAIPGCGGPPPIDEGGIGGYWDCLGGAWAFNGKLPLDEELGADETTASRCAGGINLSLTGIDSLL